MTVEATIITTIVLIIMIFVLTAFIDISSETVMRIRIETAFMRSVYGDDEYKDDDQDEDQDDMALIDLKAENYGFFKQYESETIYDIVNPLKIFDNKEVVTKVVKRSDRIYWTRLWLSVKDDVSQNDLFGGNKIVLE